MIRALNEYQFDEVTNLFCFVYQLKSLHHAHIHMCMSPSFLLPHPLLPPLPQELESAISDFAAQTKIDAKDRRALTSLTYEDVYWASKIENPLVRCIPIRNAGYVNGGHTKLFIALDLLKASAREESLGTRLTQSRGDESHATSVSFPLLLISAIAVLVHVDYITN